MVRVILALLGILCVSASAMAQVDDPSGFMGGESYLATMLVRCKTASGSFGGSYNGTSIQDRLVTLIQGKANLRGLSVCFVSADASRSRSLVREYTGSDYSVRRPGAPRRGNLAPANLVLDITLTTLLVNDQGGFSLRYDRRHSIGFSSRGRVARLQAIGGVYAIESGVLSYPVHTGWVERPVFWTDDYYVNRRRSGSYGGATLTQRQSECEAVYAALEGISSEIVSQLRPSPRIDVPELDRLRDLESRRQDPCVADNRRQDPPASATQPAIPSQPPVVRTKPEIEYEESETPSDYYITSYNPQKRTVEIEGRLARLLKPQGKGSQGDVLFFRLQPTPGFNVIGQLATAEVVVIGNAGGKVTGKVITHIPPYATPVSSEAPTKVRIR